MKTISRTVTILATVAAATLSGCADMGLANAGQSIVKTARNAVIPDQVADYKTAVSADYGTFTKAFTELKAPAVGQPEGTNDFAETNVKFVRGQQSWSGKSLKEVRLALPGDAVTARRKEVTEALKAFEAYASVRPDAKYTKLFVVAPAQADRDWLAAQLKAAGAKDVDEQVHPYVAVGFTSPTFANERPVTN